MEMFLEFFKSDSFVSFILAILTIILFLFLCKKYKLTKYQILIFVLIILFWFSVVLIRTYRKNFAEEEEKMSAIKDNIWKIILIIIAVGLIVSLIGFLMGAKRWIYINDKGGISIVDTSKEITVNDFALDSFTSMEIDADSADVEIIISDKYGIEATYFDKKDNPVWKVENNVLKVDYPQKDTLMLFNFNLSFNFKNSKLKIYLPQDAELGEADIKLSYGKVKIDELKVKELSIKNSFGDVNINNITAEDIKLTLSSGKFNVSNITAKEITAKNSYGAGYFKTVTTDRLSVKMSSGDLSLTGCTIGALDIKNSYGAVNCQDIVSGGTDINVSSGAIRLKGDLSGSTTVESSFGKITMELLKSKEEYNYNISTSFGSIMMDDEKMGGGPIGSPIVNTGGAAGNTLKISAASGSIDIAFNK